MVVWTGIESLEIEVRDSSVPFCKARQPRNGKGDAAEVGNPCLRVFCWAVREYLPDCHKNFCGALSTAVNFPYSFLLGTCIAVGSLTKAIRFFIPKIQGNGEEVMEKAKRIVSLVIILLVIAALALGIAFSK